MPNDCKNDIMSVLGDSMWKHREKHDNFVLDFYQQSQQFFFYILERKKHFLKQNLCLLVMKFSKMRSLL